MGFVMKRIKSQEKYINRGPFFFFFFDEIVLEFYYYYPQSRNFPLISGFLISNKYDFSIFCNLFITKLSRFTHLIFRLFFLLGCYNLLVFSKCSLILTRFSNTPFSIFSNICSCKYIINKTLP